eukprot:gene15547-18765_t
MRWITRERPKIDRVACPWLITRFIDPQAEFLYVPSGDVLRIAAEKDATPYDIPGVELTHEGELCSFDAFVKKYQLNEPALQQLAKIVRGADTSRLDLTPQSAGLYAISLGLSQRYSDDHEMLSHGLILYDALYAWCKECQGESPARTEAQPSAGLLPFSGSGSRSFYGCDGNLLNQYHHYARRQQRTKSKVKRRSKGQTVSSGLAPCSCFYTRETSHALQSMANCLHRASNFLAVSLTFDERLSAYFLSCPRL